MPLPPPPPELIAELARRVDQLCKTDPRSRDIRDHLTRLEHRAHRTGWDGIAAAPTLFAIEYREDRQHARCHIDTVGTRMLNAMSDQCQGNVGAAMQKYTAMIEEVSADYRGEDNGAGRGFRPSRQYTPEKDIPPQAVGMPWRLHGFGLIYEAWGLSRSATASAAELSDVFDIANARKVNVHPDKIEVRQTLYAGRDGLLWNLERIRGHAPLIHVTDPDSSERVAGMIPNALSRMTANAVGNIVPLRPVGVDKSWFRTARNGDSDV